MAAYTNTTIVADQADPAAFMGANISAAYTVTMQDLVGVYTEAYLCNFVKYDIVTNWASINAIYKLMFSEYACRAIALEGIKYDMSVFTTRIEAERMTQIHAWRMEAIINILKEISVQDFMAV